jgi:membrane-bound lytic murein transglycosylase D
MWWLLAVAVFAASSPENTLLQQLAAGPPPGVAPAVVNDPPTTYGGLSVRLDADVATWVAAYTGPLRPHTEVWLGRLDRDRDMLSQMLIAEGLPDGLVVVPVVESGLLPEATSTLGCAGTWQFSTPTARQMGLEVSERVDERRNPILAASAAVQLLGVLHQRYGNWDLALAAYNAGHPRVDAAVEAAGTERWEDVAGVLGDEPRHFLAKIHALLILDADRARWGLVPR